MNILCVICSDVLTKPESIFSTHCGHVFHFECLIQWLERSKTCPQCREKAKKCEIRKLYLSVVNETISKPSSSSSSSSSISSLSSSSSSSAYKDSIIEDLRFQILLKEKNLNCYIAQTATLKKQNTCLIKQVEKLESDIRRKDSDIYEYREKVKHLQEQNVGYKNAKEEVARVKRKNEELRSIQMLIDAPLEDVKDIVERNESPQILVKYILAMKRKMGSQQKKIKKLRITVKNLQDDLIRMEKGQFFTRQIEQFSSCDDNVITIQERSGEFEEPFDANETSDNSVITTLQNHLVTKVDSNSEVSDTENNEDCENIGRQITDEDTEAHSVDNIELNNSSDSTVLNSPGSSVSSKRCGRSKVDDSNNDSELSTVSSNLEEYSSIRNRRRVKKMKTEEDNETKHFKMNRFIDLTE